MKTHFVNSEPVSLWKSFNAMRENGQFFDLELKCGSEAKTESIFCHKLILGSFSKFWKKILLQNHAQDDTVLLLLPEVNVMDMKLLVESIYSGLAAESHVRPNDLNLSHDLASILGLKSNDVWSSQDEEEEEVKSEGDYGENFQDEDDFSLFSSLQVKLESDFEVESKTKKQSAKRKTGRKRKIARENNDEDINNEESESEDQPNSKMMYQMHPCDECNAILNTKRQHISHKQTVHFPEDKVFVSCKQCKKEVSVRKFSKHLAKFHKSHICDTCGSVYDTFQRLYDHNRRWHQVLKCSICQIEVVGYFELDRHRTKDHPSSFPCEICGKVYSIRRALSNHKRAVHTADKDKKYHCQYCSKGFVSKSYLISHVAGAHTNSKPYSCRFECGARFNDHSNVAKHEKAHHGRSFFQGKSRRKMIY